MDNGKHALPIRRCDFARLTYEKNKQLSGDVEAGLVLQGVSWMMRKTIGIATITLDVEQSVQEPLPPSESKEPATVIIIKQTIAGGIPGTTETRCLDWVYRNHSDRIFGDVKGRSQWIAAANIEDASLAKGWIEDEAEAAGPNGETHVYSIAESQAEGSWVAQQVWGFQTVDGERRYARNVVITKGDERVEFRVVYDFLD